MKEKSAPNQALRECLNCKQKYTGPTPTDPFCSLLCENRYEEAAKQTVDDEWAKK